MPNLLDDYLQPKETATIDSIAAPDGAPIKVYIPTNKLGRVEENGVDNPYISPSTGGLMDKLAKLREAIGNFASSEFSPGTRIGNRLTGAGGEERFQTWPERMVRSALTLPGDVASGEVPITDPSGHTSPTVIERVQDLAGLAGGAPLVERPGVASLGSGAVRPPPLTAPVFHSALENAVNAARQPTAPGQQWLGFLRNQVGVKPEELHWTGVEDFLNNAKGPVTKEDLLTHMKNNQVELKEINKGQFDPDSVKVDSLLDNWVDNFYEVEGRGPNRYEVEEARNSFIDDVINDPHDYPEIVGSRYGDYTLPGGENYREMLLTLPQRKDSKNYQSSHWDEPNVLAHVRMNDRDVGGKKSLHLEEIQSDWHQQGRDKGYQSSEKLTAKKVGKADVAQRPHDGRWYPRGQDNATGFDDYATREEALAAALPRWAVFDSQGNRLGTYSGTDANHAIQNFNQIRNEGFSIPAGAVPDAPFKKTWPELVMKRMIREAAEKGYDRISWTPGEAQAARYNLSKRISDLNFQRNADGSYNLWGRTSQGENHRFGQDIPKDKLSDYIGKDIAEKIVNDKKDQGQLKGADLKVGGEGMREFYDKMIPRLAEKLGKQYGVKVNKEKTGNTEVFYFDIPEGLRNISMSRGFPLFIGGVPVIAPAQQPTFTKKEKK